jgi:uracil-DNA glycosylase family 4
MPPKGAAGQPLLLSTNSQKKEWPRQTEDFEGNFYGPYFAYLMWKHQLKNVYITNLIKCRYTREGKARATPDNIIDKCVRTFLEREIGYFKPKLALCFGRKAERHLPRFARKLDYPRAYLFHPAARISRLKLIKENDDLLGAALRNFLLPT